MNTLTPDQIHKELDLIQDVVKRMADNSFKVKAWLMGILAALIAFKADTIFIGNGYSAVGLSALLFLPILCFWYLDAFFLKTEGLYRNLYKWVITNRPNTDKYLYDLNSFERHVNGNTVIIKSDSICKVARSKTLFPFYVVPLVFVLAIFFFNLYKLIQS